LNVEWFTNFKNCLLRKCVLQSSEPEILDFLIDAALVLEKASAKELEVSALTHFEYATAA